MQARNEKKTEGRIASKNKNGRLATLSLSTKAKRKKETETGEGEKNKEKVNWSRRGGRRRKGELAP